jgi:23S rRNA (guanosine2251-2'-O)-methyltransferase
MANKWHPQNGLTLYGRKPALEALANRALEVAQLHLADSNRPGGIIAQIIAQAESRNIPIQYHEKQALSRISKNGRQDQGVALDINCPRFGSVDSLLSGDPSTPQRLLAFDGITNPQNVGMIIRSAVAAGLDGLLYPKKGVAALGQRWRLAHPSHCFRIKCQRARCLYWVVRRVASATPSTNWRTNDSPSP